MKVRSRAAARTAVALLAADAMIKANGGTGKVAILFGSSGNNVTTARNEGVRRGDAELPQPNPTAAMTVWGAHTWASA